MILSRWASPQSRRPKQATLCALQHESEDGASHQNLSSTPRILPKAAQSTPPLGRLHAACGRLFWRCFPGSSIRRVGALDIGLDCQTLKRLRWYDLVYYNTIMNLRPFTPGTCTAFIQRYTGTLYSCHLCEHVGEYTARFGVQEIVAGGGRQITHVSEQCRCAAAACVVLQLTLCVLSPSRSHSRQARLAKAVSNTAVSAAVGTPLAGAPLQTAAPEYCTPAHQLFGQQAAKKFTWSPRRERVVPARCYWNLHRPSAPHNPRTRT